MNKSFLFLIFGFLLISLVSSTTTTLSSTPTSLDQDSTNLVVHYVIDNSNGNAGAKGVSINGLPIFLFYSGDPISYGANETVSGDLVLSFNIPEDTFGEFENYITIDEQVLTIPISISNEPTSGCRLIELPHTTTYRIKQGETGVSSQIRIRVSSECPEDMISMTVTEQTQMTKPMYLQGSSGDVEPGGEFSFSIGLDAEGVATGNYQNSYIVSGSLGDEIYQKSITLNTIVTVGTSPIDENSFAVMPSCNIDSDMKLNTSYSLICNNENPNIDIESPYNEFFEGTLVSESEGKIEYKIVPQKIGVTDFIVLFKYKGFVISKPFIKEIRIMQGDIPIQGTVLNVLFYQNGVKKQIKSLFSGEVTILVKDNNTQSIVPSFTAYLNGQIISNNSFNLEPDKEYELLVDSSGYLTSTLNITVNQTPLAISILPSKDYVVGDVVNITTGVENVSFLLDEYIITSPYEFKSAGEKVLKAIKDGYLTTNITIIVKEKIYLTTSSEWKKGRTITEGLNQNTTWDVYRDGVLIKSGDGKIVEFKIEDYGTWEIKSGDVGIIAKKVESGGGIIGFFKDNLVLVIIVLIVLGGGGYYLFKDKEKEEEGIPLSKYRGDE